MDYNKKLKCDRFYPSRISGRDFDEEMESDAKSGQKIKSAGAALLSGRLTKQDLKTVTNAYQLYTSL